MILAEKKIRCDMIFLAYRPPIVRKRKKSESSYLQVSLCVFVERSAVLALT